MSLGDSAALGFGFMAGYGKKRWNNINQQQQLVWNTVFQFTSQQPYIIQIFCIINLFFFSVGPVELLFSSTNVTVTARSNGLSDK